MRIFTLFIGLILSMPIIAQSGCEQELSFFPLWHKSINTGKAKYNRLNLDKLDSDAAKARKKVSAQIKLKLGPYKSQLRLDRMRQAGRVDSKDQFFVYRFSVTIERFKWGFEVSSTQSGKITSDLPFQKISKPVIDPCKAIERAEAQMHFDQAVGIKLSTENNKLVWEVWQAGESLNAKETETGLKRTAHKVLSIDARSLEIYGSRKEVLERF